jgi:hypothetical protein
MHSKGVWTTGSRVSGPEAVAFSAAKLTFWTGFAALLDVPVHPWPAEPLGDSQKGLHEGQMSSPRDSVLSSTPPQLLGKVSVCTATLPPQLALCVFHTSLPV